MPENTPENRFARAAGKATRSFLDGRQRDAERARTERQARAAAEALAEREDEARRRERAGSRGSVLLRTARWWWAVTTAAFALLTVSFIVAGATARGVEPVPPVPGGDSWFTGAFSGRTELYVLAAVTGILTLVTGTGAVQLMRSRRSAVGILTAVAVIAGVPLIVRGHPLLITFAVILLVGAVLLWLPAARRRLRPN